MTDEEKAIDYICNEYYEADIKGFTYKEKIILREEIKENDKKKIKLYLAGLAEGRKDSESFIIFHNKEEMEVLKKLLDEECNKGTVDTVIWNLRSRINTRLIQVKD